MSGKESSQGDSRCQSGISPLQHFKEKEQPGITSTGSGVTQFAPSEKCVYESFSDSGVWSGSNIHSDISIHSESSLPLEYPESPKPSEPTNIYDSEKVPGVTSSTYMRLDSGIGIDTHLSQLSLKDCDSLNDLSAKDALIDSSKDTKVLQSETQCAKPSSEDSLLDIYFQQNDDGDTQLHLAIMDKFIEGVFALVRLVPNASYLNIRNNDRQTSLHLAVLAGQPRLARLLVSAGAALDQVDCEGNTALHLAVGLGSLECVKALLTPVTVADVTYAGLKYTPLFPNKNFIDIHNYQGLTCLHMAALSGNINMFTLLLSAGADINAKEWKGGDTCLHMAVETRDILLCQHLLTQSSLNIEEVNYAGHTAYQEACGGRWAPTIAHLLRESGVDTYLSDSDTSDSNDEDEDMVDDCCCLRQNGVGLVDARA